MAAKPDERDYGRVAVRADGLTFNAFGPDGHKVASTDVYLLDLIEEKDVHGLLLLGVFMQLVTLNGAVAKQSERLESAGSPTDTIDAVVEKAMAALRGSGMPEIPDIPVVERPESKED